MKNNIRAVCETQKRLNLDYHLQKNTSNKYAFDNNFVEDRGHKLVYCFHEKVTNTPKTRFSEHWFSESRFSEKLDLMNKLQLPFSIFTLNPDLI